MNENSFTIKPDKRLLIKFMIISLIISLVVLFLSRSIEIAILLLFVSLLSFVISVSPALFETIEVEGNKLKYKAIFPWSRKEFSIDSITEINKRNFVRITRFIRIKTIIIENPTEMMHIQRMVYLDEDIEKLIKYIKNTNSKVKFITKIR